MSDYLAVPIGVDDYKEIIDKKLCYVDKTLLIKEFWQDGAKVVLIPRPRRFGKSLNLSMLKYFFEKTGQNTAYLFEKMNIWNHSEYHALQGQFPVIFLTFKDIRADTWEIAYERIANLVAEECKRLLLSKNITIEKIDSFDVNIFNRLRSREASAQELKDSLQFLTYLLYNQTGQKVIILIDEYDTPVIHSYLKNYYPKMIEFMRDLLSRLLKTNAALERGLLTGITRTAREGIFSGLNHVAVYTVLNFQYADKFGFIQDNVDTLLVSFDLADKKDEIKRWYNGYFVGQTQVYNPWSVLNCIANKGELKTYWANTSNNDLIRDLIASSSQEVKDDVELLIQGKEIVDKEIVEDVSMRDLKNNSQALWGLFLATGYLTVTSRTFKDERYYYTLALPNTEIRLLYKELIFNAIDQSLVSGRISELFTALMVGDLYKLTNLLQEFVENSCSFYDLPTKDLERSMHLFVLGLLAGLSNRYIIQSNRESGDGRYDIMLMPRKPQDPGILIEFKRAESSSLKDLEALAHKALVQIAELGYQKQMRDFGYQGSIVCYGIAAYGKNLTVKMEKIPAVAM